MSDWTGNFTLNFTASLYHVTITNDGMGGVTETKVLYATVPCAFWQLGASEMLANDRIKNPTTHKMACKPVSGTLGSDLVKINGVEYRIAKSDNILGYNDLQTIDMYLEG
jgi:hypothetical protein